VGVKHQPDLPLHAKPIDVCKLKELDRLSEGTEWENEWKEISSFLYDPANFANVPPVNLADARCSLTEKEIRQLFEDDFMELVPAGVMILGVVRCYKLLELLKARYRLINWTYTANLDNDPAKNYVSLPSLGDTRTLVHRGSCAFSVDVEAAFNQFELHPLVRQYFCVRVPYKGKEVWMRLKRMPMGWRPACRLTQCATRLLTKGFFCHNEVYIDGICGVGEQDRLVADLHTLAANARQANLKFKEDLSDPRKLVSEQVEFLGLRLCFRTKQVKLGDKTIAKLTVLWLRGENGAWTLRDFISCVAICFYHASATAGGARIGRHQYVLQRWAKYQSTLSHLRLNNVDGLGNAFLWSEEPLLHEQLSVWVSEVLTNAWVPVPKEPVGYDFLLVTDASALGWCGILISPQCGKTTVASGAWHEAITDYVQASAHAEPLALLAGMTALINPATSARILHIGDNQGTVAMVNKGYSTAASQFVMEIIASRWKTIRLRSLYYEGETLPADGPSRGQPMNKEHLQLLCQQFGVELGDIRYGNLEEDLSDSPVSD
jgi:hypothetical protein